MDLSNMIRDKDPAGLRAVLCAFGTESRILFSKSPTDRWTLWSYALLLEGQHSSEAERKRKYEELTRLAVTSLREEDEDELSIDDPLLTEGGTWSRRFQDRDLLEEVQKDVARLFVGEDEVFAPCAVRVLHLWSKLHETISYRQGMHELLRPIIIASAQSSKMNGKIVEEADIFFMFQGLMTELSCLYEHNTSSALTTSSLSASTGSATSTTTTSSKRAFTTATSSNPTPLHRVCWDIHNRLLFRAAPDVKQKLDILVVEPQFYALRWMRCLFTREFTEKHCAGYWDSLLSQTFFEPSKNSLIELASFFAVAMLLRVRNQIMEATSQAEALEPLLRFPAFPSDNEAVQLAIQAARLRVLRDGPSPPRAILNDDLPKQHRLGARLAFIVAELEKQLTVEDSERDENKMLQYLAQAKQIHDVLLDRLSEDDCYWGE